MDETLLERSFDFSVRLTELAKYLRDEGREFPMTQRLLTCGVGMGVNLRLAALASGKEQMAKKVLAQAFAVESGYLLELMAKAGTLTELQSKPLLEDCDRLLAALSNG